MHIKLFCKHEILKKNITKIFKSFACEYETFEMNVNTIEVLNSFHKTTHAISKVIMFKKTVI